MWFSENLPAGILFAALVVAMGRGAAAPAAERLTTAGVPVALIGAEGRGSGAEGRGATSHDPRPTAHEPRFDDKTLWPDLSGKEYFLKEQWPRGRLYVWGYPGETANLHRGRSRSPRDPADPKNWLVDGRPAEELIFDEHADLLLPASEVPYEVGFRNTELQETFRHVTVEPGAAFIGGGDGRGRTIYGNVWIKRGGAMYAQGATNFVGPHHTFFRNDNLAPSEDDNGRDGRRCSQYFVFNKEDGASVEFRGQVSVSDEFRVYSGTVIVGRDSSLRPGRHAAPRIYGEGVLALLDGAFFGKWCNDFGIPDMTVEGGTIQGGLPERPLERSCTFGLSFKNHTNATFWQLNEEEHQESRRVPSLVLLEGSTIRSITADPAKARLVLTYVPDGVGDRSSFDLRPLPGSATEQEVLDRDPQAAARFAWFDRLPRGLDVFLGRGVVVDTVEFDNLRAGGILYQDAATKAAWENMIFGAGCLAQGDALFTHVEKLGRNGEY